MKDVLLASLVLILTSVPVRSQIIENSGKPIAEIFTDFHYSLSGLPKTTGFSMTRAQFGYNYFASENFSALIKVEIGKPEELAAGSKERRYAFYREASISYNKDKLNISFGITSTRLFEYQQKFWGKRYVADTYQSINGYGYVADLGLSADYKLNDIVEFDIALMNGEGYSNIQLDNNLKSSLGITVTPSGNLAFRAYGDILKTSGLWQTTLIGFAGFKNEKITIGGEISYKSNLVLSAGHNAWGFSGTGAVSLTKKIEFFTRYDYSTSVVVPGDALQWNLSKDGSFLITGFQYTFNKFVKVAIDYQGGFPANKNYGTFSDLIYFNSVFKF
jgi:hypothetical protein